MTMLLAALLCTATQEVENPEYKHWASFKVGSFVKLKSEIENEGRKMELPLEITFTLIELDDKKAVIEEVTVNTMQPKDSPKQEKAKKKTVRATRKAEDVKEGDEEVEVAGKKLACHWTEIKGPGGVFKMWTNPEVPGPVKMEVGMVSKSIQRLTASSWEKK